jgi:hypothetical protein
MRGSGRMSQESKCTKYGGAECSERCAASCESGYVGSTSADTSRKRSCRVAFGSFDAGGRNCAGRCGNGPCSKALSRFCFSFAGIEHRTTTRFGICGNRNAASDQHASTYLSCGS